MICSATLWSEAAQMKQTFLEMSVQVLIRFRQLRDSDGRSLCPRGPWLLGSRVRNPLMVWMFVSCVCSVLCRYGPLRWDDNLFKGVLPSVVCLIVCEPDTSTLRRSRQGLGSCTTEKQKRNYDFKLCIANLALWQWKLHANNVSGINTSSKVISWMKLRKSHWG
jgi:hypothetical protein